MVWGGVEVSLIHVAAPTKGRYHEAFGTVSMSQTLSLSSEAAKTHPGLMVELPSDDRHDKDWNADVGCDKIRGRPVSFQKDRETGDERDNDGADESNPSRVRLKWSLPWESVAINALYLQSAVESDVTKTQSSPRN